MQKNQINYNRKKFKNNFKSLDALLNSTPQDFFSSHLFSSSVFFNLYASWNINSYNNEKKDRVVYFNLIFKPVFAFRKLLTVSFPVMNVPPHPSFTITFQFSFVQIKEILGIGSLCIDVRFSFSFNMKPFLYKYIISIWI